jgi:UMF1 family MFS transporter
MDENPEKRSRPGASVDVDVETSAGPATRPPLDAGEGGRVQEHRPQARSVWSWVLYDLANTIYSMNIASLYFSLWVVNVMGGSDADFGNATSISFFILFVTAPFLGALTDQASRRLPFLIASTLLCVGFTLLLGTGGLGASLVYFVVANAAYQAGLQFYDALLPEVSTEATRGRVSGIGVGMGYVGSFLGVAVATLLLRGVDDLPQPEQSDRYRTVFLSTAGLFLLFALPAFFFIRERVRPGRHFTLASVGAATRQVLQTVRESRRYPGLARFLVGRVFYTDAVNTVIAFMGIYVVNEVGFAQADVAKVMLTAISFAAIGGFLWGRVVDRIGPKRTLDMVLFLWMVVFLWVAAVGYFHLPKAVFWPAAVGAGLALGGTWASDRPYMLRLTPPDRVGEFYGLYGMVGRFSAITGPFVWSLVVDRLGLGRPTAVVTLLFGIVIGYLILRRVSDSPRDWSAEETPRLSHAP